MDYEKQIEELREDLIRQVNQKCDSLLEAYRNGGQCDLHEKRECEHRLIAVSPAELKGKKPLAIQTKSGEWIETLTWKKVVQKILQTYNENPESHKKFMDMRGKVFGRWGAILESTPDNMSVPLKIDENLYFEAKFDTETMIKVLLEKVLTPANCDCSEIKIRYKE